MVYVSCWEETFFIQTESQILTEMKKMFKITMHFEECFYIPDWKENMSALQWPTKNYSCLIF